MIDSTVEKAWRRMNSYTEGVFRLELERMKQDQNTKTFEDSLLNGIVLIAAIVSFYGFPTRGVPPVPTLSIYRR